MSNLYEQIGQKIRELRTAYPKGSLSQGALAAKLEISPNTVSRWETGTYKPTPEDLDKLSRLFSVSINVFFPRLKPDRINALTSATGGLGKDDFEEVIRYAEFRRALTAQSTTRKKGTGN